MRLWLVRHAATAVPPGICYGVSDIPADPLATADAARRLDAVLPARLGWRVSPLSRARQLAQALRERRPDLTAPVVDPNLGELDFGAWERLPWDGVPRGELDAWAADFADYRPGGGESVRMLLRRVRHALRTAMVDDVDDQVWITHAGVIRAVRYTLQWGDTAAMPRTAEDWPREAPAPGQWVCIELADTREA
ncbi:MAG: histidine phosphatase family protein [Tepidimonas sp.]|uniref:histidine phosphatase family protein n=1 Tax=Tepidimonas sp. TaxID=2002775 RepID=UPI00259EC1DC|nr:histidine phosphatase family protein [Tepidimonas sp.]MDM7457453.1 histidine phosphatase family protein [Tepidimonas sp.]